MPCFRLLISSTSDTSRICAVSAMLSQVHTPTNSSCFKRISHVFQSNSSQVDGASLVGFQNCIMRPSFFVLLFFAIFACASPSGVSSVDSLLRSPCELLIRRLRLIKLERRRPNAADDTDDGRCSRRLGWYGRAVGVNALSRVMVDVLDVNDGIS